MLTINLKSRLMDYILDNSIKCSYNLDKQYKEVEILSKKKTAEGISIYIAFGGSDVGIIDNIKIIDSTNTAILEDSRVFNKTDDNVLSILLRIDRMEVV